MTDRELLERAAKAAGIEVVRSRLDDQMFRDMLVLWSARSPTQKFGPWNPLEDDGDALRLAVKRKIFRCHMDLFHKFYEEEIANGLAEQAATRRAIVRAAAAMSEDV